jgi:SAM-dependent methyltransferase
MELARSLGAVEDCPVLDVGAGSGRNTLPLARLGLRTDAVEITPTLVTALKEAAAKEQLQVRVFQGDILNESLPLPHNHYGMVVLAEVVSHFRSLEEMRHLFVLADKLLKSNGLLIFNSFVARDGYEPDNLARQVAQLMWSSLFTEEELRKAAAGLSFERLSSEPACEYEKARLPAADWPPTGWFEAWSAGTGLFDLPMDKCPMELRWLVYRKTR